MNKPLPWFRLHADILSDEKVLCLAVSDRWYFVAVLALKCSGIIDKYQEPELSRKVAAKLGIDSFESQELKRRLLDEELIDEKWQPTAWEARQYVTDAGAAERMRAYRQRKKSKENNAPPLRNALRPREQNTDTDISSLRSDNSAREKTPRDELSEVLDAEHSEAVIEHRKRIRKPLTAYAAKLLARQLVQWRDPNEAADAMIANGWQGFKPEWLAGREAQQKQTGHRNQGMIEAFAELAREDQQ